MAFEDGVRKVRGMIDKHGFAVQAVASDPPILYTMGLGFASTPIHPEIVLVGFGPQTGSWMISMIAEAIRQRGIRFDRPCLYDGLLEGYDVAFRPVTAAVVDAHLGHLALHSDAPFDSAVQLILPDKAGKFPWHPGCDPSISKRQTRGFAWEGEVPAEHVAEPSTDVRPG
jgi:hypothetical protein